MKSVGVFGSTGSIGVNALDVIERHADRFRVGALAAGSSVDSLAEQALRWRPEVLVVGRPENEAPLREALGRHARDFRILAGPDGLREAARDDALDVVLSAISGACGLPVTLGAVETGKRTALANKESMVMAGPLLNAMAAETGADIVPVDSEHSALFQCLAGGDIDDVGRLILTASGGPFRELPKDEFPAVTVERALKHPTWTMGRKITIDSATMMNKALEIVEARWLFDVSHDRIEVVVHPQSIVHSMVYWKDGSVIAQMGAPDMRLPIQYALSHPDRLEAPRVDTWSPELFDGLRFHRPDPERFSSLTLGFLAAERGGTYGAVLNAANEEAVERFFSGTLGFQGIFDAVGRVMERHDPVVRPSLEEILSADAWAREELNRCC